MVGVVGGFGLPASRAESEFPPEAPAPPWPAAHAAIGGPGANFRLTEGLKVCLFFCETGRGDPRDPSQTEMAEMDGAAGKEAWPNVAQGQVRVHRTFLVFTSDAAKPVVASGVVVGFDRRYARALVALLVFLFAANPDRTPQAFWVLLG